MSNIFSARPTKPAALPSLTPDGADITFEFEHSGLVVEDLDAAVAFYTRVFGLVLVAVDPDFYDIDPSTIGASGPVCLRGAYLSAGAANLELHQFSPSLPTRRSVTDLGYGHISFSVTNIQTAYDALRSTGMTFYSAPNYVPGGAMVGRWWVYGEDPWGNVIELAQPAAVAHNAPLPTAATGVPTI